MSCPASRTCSNPRAFVTLTHGRLKRGSLDMLPSLFLDVLCEIFCFLHPADLLVLARTTKAFRRFLLKRSAAFIWRSARRNVDGLPEPPSDMTEVQYASLVFGSACHYQGCDGKARDIVWHLRIRSCASCRPKYRPIKPDDCDDYLSICAMLARCPGTPEQYIPCGPFLNSRGKPMKGFQEHHVKTFANELRALHLSDHQAFLDRRRQDTEVIGQFASVGVAWQLKEKGARNAVQRNKRAARAEMIREKLIAMGFQEEIEHFGWDRIRKHSLIDNTQALTDRACPSVLDQLGEYMMGWRELRMEERVYAFRRRVFVDAWSRFTTILFRNAASGCPYLPLPPNATIGFSERIGSIIRQPSPMSHEILSEQLHAAFPLTCEEILEWHKTTRRTLASLLPDYRVDDDDEAVHTRLKLAASIFQCTAGCCRSEGRPLAYPEILFHPCFTPVTQGNGPSSKDPRSIAHQKACLVMGGPWNSIGRVQVHPRQYVVNKIIACYGRDPGSTTASEMDKQSCRLVCLECASRHRRITLMSWRSAVEHYIALHPDFSHKYPRCMLVNHVPRSPNAIPGSKNLQSSPSMPGHRLRDYSVCLLCPPRIPSWNTHFGTGDLTDHIKDEHGVLLPVLGKHYMFDCNVTPIHSDFVVIN